MDFWQFTPFAFVFLTAEILTLGIIVLALKYKYIQGSKYFAYMLTSIAVWILGSSLGVFSRNLEFKMLVLRLEYLGIVCTPVFWVFFVSSYTKSDYWLNSKIRFLLLFVPAITFLQILFVKQHHFFYVTHSLGSYENLLVFQKKYGPGFYAWMIYSYSLILLGAYILIRGLIKKPSYFKGQITAHVLMILVVIVPNVFYITGHNPIEPYDPICLSFVLMALLYVYIIQKHKFLYIVPVAHSQVFNNVKIGVIVTDNGQTILDVNSAAVNILGKKKKGVLGKQLDETTSLFNNLIKKIFNNSEYNTEIEYLNKTYDLRSSILANKRNIDSGRIIMLYDITEKKQAIKELDAYSHTVAHNLKNPITSVHGFVDILSNMENSEEQKEYLYLNLKEATFKMASIIDGLLLLSKLRNHQEVETVDLNMNKIVRYATERLQKNIDLKKATIYLPKTWHTAKGYPIWIEEIWMNYISNALKYGGEPPIIKLGSEETETGIKFWLKDNGQGIKEEDQLILFQEFTQLNKNSSEGYGLGLSIVKRIAQKLNGTVGLESVPGEGSCFYFILPMD